MNMTPIQLREYADALEAWPSPVEYWDAAQKAWVIERFHPEVWSYTPHRPKPEPKTRPWSKPDDVPVGVVYMRSAHFKEGFSVLISAGVRGIQIPTYTHENAVIEWGDIAGMEYSTDRKTWHKCEVTEE